MDNDLFSKVFLLESKTDEVYIDDDFFVLYREGRLYYYKEIEEKLDIDDLKLFIKNSLGVSDIKVISLNNAKIKNKDDTNYNFIKAIKKPYFLFYILYLVVLFIIFVFLYLNISKEHKKDEFDNLKTNIEEIKKDNKFIYITKIVFNIYENAKLNNVTVNSILFENSKVLLKLESIKKDGIYNLLKKIKKSAIEDMQYNEESKRYRAHVSFKIFRN